MRADEAFQLEQENRQRDEWEAHRRLVNEFGRECRAFLKHILKPTKERTNETPDVWR